MAYNDAVEVFRDTEYPMMKGKHMPIVKGTHTKLCQQGRFTLTMAALPFMQSH